MSIARRFKRQKKAEVGGRSANVEAAKSLKAMIALLIRRKRKYFGGNRRLILDYDIVAKDDIRNIMISSIERSGWNDKGHSGDDG